MLNNERYVGRKNWGICLFLCAAALSTSLCALNAFGTTGGIIHLPVVKPKPGSPPAIAYSRPTGLHLKIDTTWASDRGYRPVRVMISSNGPSPSDRLLTVRFFAGDWNSDGKAINVEQDFMLARGSSTVTVTMAVPQHDQWQFTCWDVWVDGEKDESLSAERQAIGANRVNSTGFSVLIVGQETQRSAAIERLFAKWTENGGDVSKMLASDMPTRWIDYSGLNTVVLSSQLANQLQPKYPARLEALLRWARTGGNLLIHDVGDRWEGLPELEKTLGLAATTEGGSNSASGAELQDHGWQYFRAPKTGSDESRLDYGGWFQFRNYAQLAFERIGRNHSNRAELPIAMQSYGMGTIFTLCDSLHKFGKQEQSNRSRHAMNLWFRALQEHYGWQERHGFNPGTANVEFNNWLIPGVGIAPVTEFQVLISFFVIAIGPVNYWLLRRWKRLPLFLLTVPLSAILVTLLLFAYGLLADGIGLRARARSFTLLDQQTGEAVCWARTSYYAGMAPAGGMRFSVDTAVYPILPAWAQSRQLSRRYKAQRRELLWTETEQQLPNGWLPSRTPTQFLTISARKSTKRLEVKNTDDGLQVRNELGTLVKSLAAEDHEGNFYWTEQIEPGESVVLNPVPFSELVMNLRKIFSENQPEFPAGAQAQGTSSFGPQLSSNLLETHLSTIVDPTNRSLGNSTYVAITATGLEYDTGVSTAKEIASFHVVQGKWPRE